MKTVNIFRKVIQFHAIMAISLLTLSCSKDEDNNEPPTDECADITCLNGGECVDGSCDCPPGYSGEDCNEFDTGGGDGGSACEGVECENGGYCEGGNCICPQGYEGAECENQIEPSLIRITSIEVSEIPEADIFTWDYSIDDTGPDIYVEILYGNGDLIHWSEVVYNVTLYSSYSHTFHFSPPVIVNDINGTHIFRLRDEDLGEEDDHLGGVQTSGLYHPSNDFPPYISTGGGLVAFKVSLEYEW